MARKASLKSGPWQKRTLAMALHHTQEFYDDLGRGPDQHLAFATALGVDNVILQYHLNLYSSRAFMRLTRQSFYMECQ